MSDDHLRKCVIDELRKAQGEPLSGEELFERCGGAKTTNLTVDAFRHFIGQHCSRAVKAVHDTGDENSLPRYALHVDHARKTGTLKRRTARSKSQSSSRGGTPEGNTARFNPKAEGFLVFCQIVRRLSAASQDGTINWNAIRNQYRKETGRHLLTEELNGMCGTVNMTKHELLTTYLSSVVEIVDSRGQIVRPASPFIPKTPSPIASQSHPKDEELSPVVSAAAEELRSEVMQTPSREALSPESDQASFMSVNQTLETSGEVGYITGDDATPESDISLDFTANNSALNSTPCRTHEITLCNADDSDIHREEDENIVKNVVEEDVVAEADHSEDGHEFEPDDSYHQIGEEKMRSDSPLEHPKRESAIVIEEKELDEPVEVVGKRSSTENVVEVVESLAEGKNREIPSILITEPCDEIAAKKDCQQIKNEQEVVGNEEQEENKDVVSVQDSDIGEEYVLESHVTSKVRVSSSTVEDIEAFTIQGRERTLAAQVTPVKERRMVFEGGEEELELPTTEVVLNAEGAVKEQVEKFEHMQEENLDESRVSHIDEGDLDDLERVDGAVKEQVEKFEHMQEENLDESRVSHISEGDLDKLERVDVMERVQELEQSAIVREDSVMEHEEEAIPAATHVLETVHKLEHEIDKSLPICEEYIHIAEHEKEQMQETGDMASSESVSEESVQLGPAGDVVASYEVETTQREGAKFEAVTVTVEEVIVDPSGFSEETEAKISPFTNAAVTHTVVVDVIPRMEDKPKLSNSDSWEKTFVVASGSAAMELSGSRLATSVERDVTAARDFLREVDKLEIESEDESAFKEEEGADDVNKIQELSTTEELPSLPPVATGDDNAEAKNMQLSKKRGRALRQRRLMDCCTVL